MENEKTLKDYNIQEGKFLVVMLQKPKPKPKPKEEPVQPATTEPAQTEATPAQTTDQNQPAPAQAQAPAQPAQPAAWSESEQASLTEMEAMGFPRDQCEAALRAAFGHQERAVEYLLTGIPDNIPAQQPPAAAPTGAPPGGAPGAGDFAALTSNPMFGQLRERILQDPQFFQQFM